MPLWPRRRKKGEEPDTAAPDAQSESVAPPKADDAPADPEAPKPRRRRTAAAASETAETVAAAEGGEAEAPAPRRRTRRPATTDAPEGATTGEAPATPAPRRRRTTKAAAEGEAPVEAGAEGEAPAEEKPKRTRSRRPAKAVAAEGEAPVEAGAEGEAPAEEKPKRTRSRRPAKAVAAEGEAPVEAGAEGEAPAEEKPKRTRSRRPAKAVAAEGEAPVEAAAEGAAAEGEPAAEGEEKPKRSRRRRKKPAEGEEAVATEGSKAAGGEAAAAKKPSRSRRKKDEDGEESGSKTRRRRATPKRSSLPPVRKEMLISVDVGEQRVAVIEDGAVVEVYLERRGRRSVAGNIYKGIVDNVLPGMEASFVDIGLGRNGFLYVDEIVVPELEGKKHNRRIQDLISRGQRVLVQAVKDPMGTKGARLTTEISLPGRFVVYVPYGEGIGVSRRLSDGERDRLKAICKGLELPEGGIIVRTAAEGASEEEIAGDVDLLWKLWQTIKSREESAPAPSLVYQEAELPLRIVRDLFIRDFERLVVDHRPTYERIVGFLRRTSPDLAAHVELYEDPEPLMLASGVQHAVRSTLDRRVDLPSGGYLIFDYAEALTVIDVNTGRFVGARGKNSQTRLEDTITKNNLEAAKEIVRQLRLRDIGGIIVIDFIDMANPKNRREVEEALQLELERDRTKTYVVEISPLGLVEMTRQNVTDGPREILTKRCQTCHGDGIVVSDETHAIDAERVLRAHLGRSHAEAFRIEVNPRIASILVGSAGSRIAELERETGRAFALDPVDDVPPDHVQVVAEGSVEAMRTRGLPVEVGQELEVELGARDGIDTAAAVAQLDGYAIVVGGAADRVGKRARIRVERAERGSAWASLLDLPAPPPSPVEASQLIAEEDARGLLTLPERVLATRAVEAAEPDEGEAQVEGEATGGDAGDEDGEAAARKRTRRGKRGGRRRRKPGTEGEGEATPAEGEGDEAAEGEPGAPEEEPGDAVDAEGDGEGEADEAEPGETAEGEGAPKRRRSRRGSRGGRRRRKPGAVVEGEAVEGEAAETGAVGDDAGIAPEDGAEPTDEPVELPEEAPAEEAPAEEKPKRRRSRAKAAPAEDAGDEAPAADAPDAPEDVPARPRARRARAAADGEAASSTVRRRERRIALPERPEGQPTAAVSGYFLSEKPPVPDDTKPLPDEAAGVLPEPAGEVVPEPPLAEPIEAEADVAPAEPPAGEEAAEAALDEPAVAAEDAAEEPAEPAEEPAVPAEKPAVPAEEPAAAAEPPAEEPPAPAPRKRAPRRKATPAAAGEDAAAAAEPAADGDAAAAPAAGDEAAEPAPAPRKRASRARKKPVEEAPADAEAAPATDGVADAAESG